MRLMRRSAQVAAFRRRNPSALGDRLLLGLGRPLAAKRHLLSLSLPAVPRARPRCSRRCVGPLQCHLVVAFWELRVSTQLPSRRGLRLGRKFELAHHAPALRSLCLRLLGPFRGRIHPVRVGESHLAFDLAHDYLVGIHEHHSRQRLRGLLCVLGGQRDFPAAALPHALLLVVRPFRGFFLGVYQQRDALASGCCFCERLSRGFDHAAIAKW